MAQSFAGYVYIIGSRSIIMEAEAAKLDGADAMFKAYLG